MSIIEIKDIDIMILSYVDSLDILSTYFKDIFDDQNFWKLRLENKLGFTSNNNIDYKLVVKILENEESIEENYYVSDKDISDQLITLYNDIHPVFLLTEIHIVLEQLLDYASKPYEEFIDIIIKESNGLDKVMDYTTRIVNSKNENLSKRGLYKTIDNIVIKPDKLTFDLTREYFDQIISKPKTLLISTFIDRRSEDESEDSAENYPNNEDWREDIIQLNNIENLTNGQLLHKLAQSLHQRIFTSGTYDYSLSFDGLIYNGGKYYIMHYFHQLMIDALLTPDEKKIAKYNY